jgi:hypothetical protein
MITGVGYAELFTLPHNTGTWVAALSEAGFEPAGRAEPGGRSAHIMQLAGARIVVSAVHPGSVAEKHVDRHGEGLADVAFLARGWPAAAVRALEAGAVPAPAPEQPLLALPRRPGVTLTGPGNLRHTIYEDAGSRPPRSPMAIVHAAGGAGQSATRAAGWYVEAFGFDVRPPGSYAARDAVITVAGRSAACAGHLALAIPDVTSAPARHVRRPAGLDGCCTPAGSEPDDNPGAIGGAPFITVALPPPARFCLALHWQPSVR